jgi:hypothetical protein
MIMLAALGRCSWSVIRLPSGESGWGNWRRTRNRMRSRLSPEFSINFRDALYWYQDVTFGEDESCV